MKLDIEIREPKTEREFEQYYQLRWKILRKPWNQPTGTEKDEFEETSIHLAAFLKENIIGCGRGHLINPKQAQIRWMVVEEKYRGQGFGAKLLKVLEEKLFATSASEIILKAREKAVSLYKMQGYEIYKEGEVLFGEIKHYWMRKKIEENEK